MRLRGPLRRSATAAAGERALAAPPPARLFGWLVRQNAGWLGWGLLVVLLWRGSVFVVPVALGRAIDVGVVAGDRAQGLAWVGVTLALALAQAGLSAGRHWVHDVSLVTATSRLRRQLVNAVQSLDVRWYATRPRGEIVSLVYNDARTATMFIEPLLRLASAAVVLVVVGGALASLSPPLAWTALITLPAMALAIRFGAPRIRARASDLQRSTAAMLGRLEETVTGVVVVKSLGAQDTVLGALEATSDDARRAAVRLERARAVLDGFTRLGPALSVGAGILVGGREVVGGRLSLGEFTAFVTWMGLLAGVIRELTGRVSSLLGCLASCERLERLLRHRRAESGGGTAVPPSPSVGVEGLTLRAGATHAVLDDVTLTAAPGDRVAVVGRTGAGKSTLLMVMAGLSQPAAGRVVVGGADLRRFGTAAQRATVSLVGEDAFCFDDSVRANLRLGCPGATDGELWDALRLAALDELVASLPSGLDTRLGNGGRALSGGEAQRLCLARALLRRPAVLLLDDALSAVDAGTEAAVVGNLRDWPGTIVFTTHRPGFLRLATRVVRLRDGRAEEIALADVDHADLLRGAGTGDRDPDREPPDGAAGAAGETADQEDLASGTEVSGVLRRAWPRLRPFAPGIVAGSCLSLLSTVLLLVQPQVIRRAVDDGIVGGDLGVLAWSAVAYAALGAAAFVAAAGFVYVAGGAGEGALHRLRLDTWRALLGQPVAFFRARGTGELLARVTSDVQGLSSFVRMGFDRVLSAAFLLVMGLVFMAGSSLELTGAAVVAVPGPMLLLRRYARRSPPYYAARTQAEARQLDVATQAVAGLLATQATHGGGDVNRRFRRATRGYVNRAVAVVKMENRFFVPIEFGNAAVLGVIAGVGIVLVARGVTTAGTLIAFLSYVTLIQQPVNTMTELLGMLQSARVCLARLLSIQELPHDPHADRPRADPAPGAGPPAGAEPTPGAGPAARGYGVLEVVGVSFAYPGSEPVLRRVHLRVEPGRRTAVIGPTGAGKSTLARLIAGLETPSDGVVTVGGLDLGQLPGNERARLVMYLPQDSQLLTGTVADNLRLASPDATDGELTTALLDTGLGELLDRLPQGIHTAVGGRGGRLSAGERQLIALARVALRDPAVVILDESTSRIDDETAASVDAALRRLGGRRCLLTIAHHPSTIAAADDVYRLENGAVTRERPGRS